MLKELFSFTYIDQKNELPFLVEYNIFGQTVRPECLSSAWKEESGWLHKQSRFQLAYNYQQYSDYGRGQKVQTRPNQGGQM